MNWNNQLGTPENSSLHILLFNDRLKMESGVMHSVSTNFSTIGSKIEHYRKIHGSL